MEEITMTVLGSILDENCVVNIYDDVARFGVSKSVSDVILSHISKTFDPQDYVCDIYISTISAEIIGIRVISLDDDFAEDVFFTPNIDNPLYKLICEHLVCMARAEICC